MSVSRGSSAEIAGREAALLRAGAVCAVVGTILYAVVSVLRGHPPVEDSLRMLNHVASHPEWRLLHLGGIFAVVLWIAALTAFSLSLNRDNAWGLSRIAQAVLVLASAVSTVDSSIDGFALRDLADSWTSLEGDAQAEVLNQTVTVLVVLGSVAFTAQVLLGLSFVLYGFTVIYSDEHAEWFGWIAVVAGVGWMVGAVNMSFDVVLSFAALAWIWMLLLAVLMWRAASRRV